MLGDNILVFIFGLIVGSFLNCVICRLETGEKLSGRSYCPNCKNKLSWIDLFPVLSFLLLKGKCRYCNKKISWQYPIAEMSTGLIFLLILNQFEVLNFLNLLNLVFLFYVASVLIVIFFYDLKHYLIPDKVLFPAITVASTFRVFEFLILKNWGLFGIWNLEFVISAPIFGYLLASLIATGLFLAIYLVSGGQWMGFGDVKLAILLGLVVGWPNILTALFLAFTFGAIIGIIAIALNKKGLKSQIPFAPLLIAGTFTSLLWGEQLFNWYFSALII